MKLTVIRQKYNNDCTIGVLVCENALFYTLEDVVRGPDDEKVYGKTAIPAGVYRVIVDYSTKFKRKLPLLMDVPGFIGIRIHGGNTAADTSGCILVGKHKGSAMIWGSAENAVIDILLKSKETNYIEIVNTFPYNGK